MDEQVKSLEYLAKAHDLVELADFMSDRDFEEAMNLAMKCIAKPNLPPAYAREAVIKMQGYAFKFKMQGQVYMTIRKGKTGTEENHKKNIYFSVSEQCHELAQSLKYMLKDV